MNQPMSMLDPTMESTPLRREGLPLPASLDGLTVGLLDISKSRGDRFLDRLDAHLRGRGVETTRFAKPAFTRPAPLALQQAIAARCHVVIEALAD